MTPFDVARAGVLVRLPPDRVFDLFTRDIDRWWQRGRAWRAGRASVLHLEPWVGGRLFEAFDGPAGPQVLPTGQVTLWEPPARLGLAWRGVNLGPEEWTEVLVTFRPQSNGTWVQVEHRGWAAIPPDHRVRHRQPPGLFLANLGRWWASLLNALAAAAVDPWLSSSSRPDDPPHPQAPDPSQRG